MSPERGPGLAWLDALTVFLGSFLLFAVQPLITKWILPWFGGGPEVWTTCLVFFQIALFAGYAYAWACERYLPGWGRVAVHGALLAVSLGVLPIGPDRAGTPLGVESPVASVLLLLGGKVGAPFVLLASTGPLVQAWFARSYPGRSPYRLYALSNVGSLVALLSYPFLVEPRWGLHTQSQGWTKCFLGFCAMSAAGMVLQGRSTSRTPEPDVDGPPSRGRVVGWILLSAIGSGMLVATTGHLGHDVAVIPFLWVLPLAAYLVSFIVAFDFPGAFLPGIYAPVTLGVIFVTVLLFVLHASSPGLVVLSIVAILAALFLICMLCHGALARLKPPSRDLTGYYLAIAGGGALGGAAVSLGAPVVFSSFMEWKVGMGAAYVGCWGLLAWIHRGFLRTHVNVAALLLVVAVVGMGFLGAFFASYGRRIESVRNFYGAVLIVESPAGTSRPLGFRDMASGRILHGRQYLDDAHRRTPTTYYLGTSGIGRAIGFYRSRPDLRVGIVGLGVGTLASYGETASQLFRFYEINPEVVRLARSRFTFLEDCPARVEIVGGDARLSLESEPPQGFHVLALDAFSGDTVPTHLLTVEAMRTWLRHLAPDGTIAVHVSNRFLDLEPVVRGMAGPFGLTTVGIELDPPESEDAAGSLWILCTRNEAALREWVPHGTKRTDPREFAWSDDRSDLFSIFRLRRSR
jgi:hypothetical protein